MTDKEYEYWCEAQDERRPTKEQLDCAENLLRKLGYDVDYYDFEEMDRWELEYLIDDLKQECK